MRSGGAGRMGVGGGRADLFVVTRSAMTSCVSQEVRGLLVAVALALVLMEGAHKGGRSLKGVVLGSKAAAASQRKRTSGGAAAAARKGQVVQRALRMAARAGSGKSKSSEDAQIAAEVAMSIKKSTALAQAADEHLDTAERKWDSFLAEGGHEVDSYPTEELVRSRSCRRCRAHGSASVWRSAARDEPADGRG